MVDLQYHRNLMRVAARDDAKHTQGRRDAIASAFDRELDNLFGIEEHRIGRKRRAGRVFHALIHG